MLPKISVIIPVKNGENYMKEAINSIKNQNMNVEIIVVDDASNDDTIKIAREAGCVVLKNEISLGPVKAKNKALDVAHGDFIMFHDHDDVMNEGAFQKLYDELENEPEAMAVMACVQDFYSPELSETEKQKTKIKNEPYWGLFTGAVLIKKEAFNIIGKFNESVTAGEIIDWQTKMQANNLKIKKVDFVATNRRIHSSNFGKTQQKTEFKDYASLLRVKLRK